MSPGRCKPVITNTALTFLNHLEGGQPKELGENEK